MYKIIVIDIIKILSSKNCNLIFWVILNIEIIGTCKNCIKKGIDKIEAIVPLSAHVLPKAKLNNSVPKKIKLSKE